MLNTVQSLAIAILIVAASIAFLWLLRYIWPAEQRRLQNELIGWQVTVLGTTYAVIIGFMLYAVWTNFQIADGNVEAEANSLVNVVRLAQNLDPAQTQKIQDLASEYVQNMLTEEWPAMNSLTVSPMSHQIILRLWATITNSEVHTAAQQATLEQMLAELSRMTEHRRMRELQVDSALPGILWGVLIVGAIVTIVSACLFGSTDFKLHLIQVSMLALLLGLLLVAIADINRPFQGAVHVSPAGFERARTTIQDMRTANR